MTGIETVLNVLQAADFVPLKKPLTVAGVEFQFAAAARGTGPSHDLVVVSTPALTPSRLLRLVDVLNRTLDSAESRRPVTVIVLGPLPPADKAELERNARVIAIADGNPTTQQVEDAAAVLIPLKLPEVSKTGRDPIEQVLDALGSRRTSEHLRLVQAATGGTPQVEDVLRQFIDSVFTEEVQTND